MRRLFLLSSVVLAVAVYACSEATDGTVPPGSAEAGSPTGTPTGSPTGTPTGQPGADSGPTFDAGANVTASSVLINEVSGGDEWIELVNSGTAAQDLAGYKVADRDKDTGEPKLSEAVTFPANTVLSPRSYAIVRGGGTGDAGKPCPDGGQSYCFNAEFGISNKNGETLFLIAPDGGTAGKVVYPADASTGDLSYARIPSGDPSGEFKTVKATPGAPNVP